MITQTPAALITDVDIAAANKDGTAATPSLRTLGSGAQQACAGDDGRLSNARLPLAHVHSGADINSGTVATARLGTGTPAASNYLRGDGVWTAPPFREKLAVARTYYVRPNGNDANTGLVNDPPGAFLTIQKAVDVASALDNGGFDITIQVADGTYTAAVVLKSFVGSGKIVIQGNSGTPANVLVSVTGGTCFTANNVLGVYSIKDMELRTTTGGDCIAASGGSQISFANLRFGACARIQILSASGARVATTNNYTISGSSPYHIFASNGIIEVTGITVTLAGTPNFSAGYAYATLLGSVNAATCTFVNGNTATGSRYGADTNGVIYTGGAGALYLPGSVAGATGTGGQYL